MDLVNIVSIVLICDSAGTIHNIIGDIDRYNSKLRL